MRLTNLTRSVILTAGIVMAATPALANAQGSVDGGILPTSGSTSFGSSAENIWDAYRFNRTFTQQEITECRAGHHEGEGNVGISPCPMRPITAMDLAVAHLLFGLVGSSSSE